MSRMGLRATRFMGWVSIIALSMSTLHAAEDSTAFSTETLLDMPLDQLLDIAMTGSSIKRVARSGALPIQILTHDDIASSGAASTTALLQMLPSMQGFVPPSSSIGAVGPNTGPGITTAALHALQSKYTLVLLDGQRLAPAALAANTTQGGDFSVNLESIPLDIIERVEILTDGASALYGSDAIAGVVNFITQKNRTDTRAYLNARAPQHPGGRGYSAGISTGHGELDRDGFNLLASYSHDDERSLQASQRGITALAGYFPFSHDGTNYIFNAGSSNTQPANLVVSALPNGAPAGTKPTSYSINPYYAANGNCGGPLTVALPVAAAKGVAAGVSCRFNYYSLVDDAPSTVRDSGMLKGIFKLNADTALWSQLLLSRADVLATLSPSAQSLGVSATNTLSPLYKAYVQPFLNANNLVINPGAPVVTMGYRTVAAGGRRDDFVTNARHFAAGADGIAMGWTYNATVTLSRSELKDTAAGGYTDFNQLSQLIAQGKVDPLMGTGGAELAPALLNGAVFWRAVSDLRMLQVSAQHGALALPGGVSTISVGGGFDSQRYRIDYNDLLMSGSGFAGQASGSDFPVGGNSARAPFEAQRRNWGVYSEWLLPLAKNFESTLAARYDSYGKTHSEDVFATTANAQTGLFDRLPAADLGNTFNAATYKLSVRWHPQEELLLRGAVSTGFKAPSLLDVANVVASHGNTSGNYACPFPGSVGCAAGSAQYFLLAGGNGLSGSDGLKPEHSKQWTLGMRFAPAGGLSLDADLWSVTITHQVLSSGVAEPVAFANPKQYAGLFVNPYLNPAGFYSIALEQLPLNGGVAHYKGIDWHLNYQTRTPLGQLQTEWTGTHMLRQDYTNTPGGAALTDLGVYGPDQAVVFRTQMRWQAALRRDALTNSLALNYKSGYVDQSYAAGTDVFLANANGTIGQSVAFAGLKVPAYFTLDWQGRYDYNKRLGFTAGIRNLLDRDPPVTLHTGGSGVAVGYDARYADPLGRTFYLTANYTF